MFQSQYSFKFLMCETDGLRFVFFFMKNQQKPVRKYEIFVLALLLQDTR